MVMAPSGAGMEPGIGGAGGINDAFIGGAGGAGIFIGGGGGQGGGFGGSATFCSLCCVSLAI